MRRKKRLNNIVDQQLVYWLEEPTSFYKSGIILSLLSWDISIPSHRIDSSTCPFNHIILCSKSLPSSELSFLLKMPLHIALLASDNLLFIPKTKLRHQLFGEASLNRLGPKTCSASVLPWNFVHCPTVDGLHGIWVYMLVPCVEFNELCGLHELIMLSFKTRPTYYGSSEFLTWPKTNPHQS